MGVDMFDPGGFGHPVEDAGDLVPVEGPAFPDDQPVEGIVTARLVDVEEFDQLGVEGNVAVVVEFPDRDP